MTNAELRNRRFVFDGFTYGRRHIENKYRIEYEDGGSIEYRDVIRYSETLPWDNLPAPLRTALLRDLHIIFGIQYWRIDRAPIFFSSFSLTSGQSDFWNTLYTKGLGEFFYRARLDHVDVVDFPFNPVARPFATSHLGQQKPLVLFSGGKDSLLTIEMLKERGTDFDLFTMSPLPAHRAMAQSLGHKHFIATRIPDEKRYDPPTHGGVIGNGFPSVAAVLFLAGLTAALFGHTSVVSACESSSDFGNLIYQGIEVNHQWSKSTEFESMLNSYVHDFVTPDLQFVSMIRDLSELETTGRFCQYPQYFESFYSCNVQLRKHSAKRWCNKCAKCAFLFACMAAYLPRPQVVRIFGADLFEKWNLIPTYRRLIGLDRFKPFECVGTPTEMKDALRLIEGREEFIGSVILRALQPFM